MVIIKRFINVLSIVIILWTIGLIPFFSYYYHSSLNYQKGLPLNYKSITETAKKYSMSGEWDDVFKDFQTTANTLKLKEFISTFTTFIAIEEYDGYLKDGEAKRKYLQDKEQMLIMKDKILAKKVKDQTMEYGLINLGGILGSFFIVFILNYILFGRIQLFHKMRK